MSRFWPTPAEAAALRFVVPVSHLRTRLLLAGALFAAGIALWSLLPLAGVVGLLLILAGHLLLWVHRQTTAPGGATPRHEEVWAPVEDGWLERIVALERRGEAWDATPWDVTSVPGFLTLLLALAVIGAGAVASGVRFGADAFFRVAVAAVILIVPLWVNGLRTTWNPSELRKRGRPWPWPATRRRKRKVSSRCRCSPCAKDPGENTRWTPASCSAPRATTARASWESRCRWR